MRARPIAKAAAAVLAMVATAANVLAMSTAATPGHGSEAMTRVSDVLALSDGPESEPVMCKKSCVARQLAKWIVQVSDGRPDSPTEQHVADILQRVQVGAFAQLRGHRVLTAIVSPGFRLPYRGSPSMARASAVLLEPC